MPRKILISSVDGVMFNFRMPGKMKNAQRGGFGGGGPSYTPPPAAPPAAAPATLASSSVAANAATRQNNMFAATQEMGTAGGAQGVSPMSVTTGKTTLGGVT